MKTMILTTLMILTATSAQASKECASSQKDAFKNLASSTQALVAHSSRGDTREDVDRDSYPHLNAIGVVKVDGQDFYGSGFLVSPCHVLTNSHVVFEDPRNAKVDAPVKFSVGENNSVQNPFKHANIDGKVIAHGNYDNTDDTRNSDWVVVKLSKSVGKEVGFIPFLQVNDPRKLAGRSVITAGFPGNRTNGGTDFSKIYADLNCKIVSTHLFGYLNNTCQTTGGQSGSPLLTKDSAGNYYAVGMVSGNNGFNMDRNEDPNKANMAVSFLSGKSVNRVTEGDKIAAALEADKCE